MARGVGRSCPLPLGVGNFFLIFQIKTCNISETVQYWSYFAPFRGYIAGFFVLLSDPHPYSTLILGVFPLHQIAHAGVSPRTGLKLLGLKLFSKNSNRCDHDT